VDAEPYESKKARDTDHHGLDMKFDAYCKQEFKFVDEGPKLVSPVLSTTEVTFRGALVEARARGVIVDPRCLPRGAVVA
jgi:hypothetical protein